MPTKPQDHKPKATREGQSVVHDDGSYTWTSPGGVSITIPDVARLSAGFMRQHRKLDEIDLVFTVMEHLLDEDELAKLDQLNLREVNRLFRAWLAESGASLPES